LVCLLNLRGYETRVRWEKVAEGRMRESKYTTHCCISFLGCALGRVVIKIFLSGLCGKKGFPINSMIVTVSGKGMAHVHKNL
jgi:hypothetical protein